jgi:hypothetical protein
LEDEETPNAPLRNYNATNEENASSSAATPAEKSKDGSRSQNWEKAIGPDESQPLSDIGRNLLSRMKPDTAEKFKAFIADKLRERQHALVPLASGSPSLALPPVSSGNIAGKEIMQVAEDKIMQVAEDKVMQVAEDEVIQVDSQGNSLTIPQHLAEQIDGSQEEEVRPESLLLHELHSRQLRGELNSIDDVRITFETVMGADFSASTLSLCMMSALGSCRARSDPIGEMAKNYAIKQDKMIEEQRLLCFEDMPAFTGK